MTVDAWIAGCLASPDRMSVGEWQADFAARFSVTCALCHGSGWIPGVAKPVGPLDELPCPACTGSCRKRNTED